MGSSVGTLLSPRSSRRLVLLIAIAVLFASIAQAAHYHKEELNRFGGTDVHCLLCLYAAGTAGPPTIRSLPTLPPGPRERRVTPCVNCVEGGYAASYEARGPPTEFR